MMCLSRTQNIQTHVRCTFRITDVLQADKIFVSMDAFEYINKRFGGEDDEEEEEVGEEEESGGESEEQIYIYVYANICNDEQIVISTSFSLHWLTKKLRNYETLKKKISTHYNKNNCLTFTNTN